MQKNNTKLVLFILFVHILISCSDNSISTISQAENGNFVLSVTNQSLDMDPALLEIYIDGKLAISKEFFWEYGRAHIKFTYQLEDGEHKITVVSSQINLTKDTTFILPSTPYCLISFLYADPRINYKGYRDISVKFLTRPPVYADLFLIGLYPFA